MCRSCTGRGRCSGGHTPSGHTAGRSSRADRHSRPPGRSRELRSPGYSALKPAHWWSAQSSSNQLHTVYKVTQNLSQIFNQFKNHIAHIKTQICGTAIEPRLGAQVCRIQLPRCTVPAHDTKLSLRPLLDVARRPARRQFITI